MNITLLQHLLGVSSYSHYEENMVRWLANFALCHLKDVQITIDKFKNVIITKGHGKYLPTVSAHLDTVHLPTDVKIEYKNNFFYGINPRTGARTGIGGDDKAGIFVCLEVLQKFKNIQAIFFAAEEVGCWGSSNIDPYLMNNVAYLIEFDSPSHHMVSYTSGGVRLFENEGKFIEKALPILKAHGSVLWQHHPFTDVKAIRQRFPISCLNLSSGYYDWHQPTEYVYVPDVKLACDLACDLIDTLDNTHYTCPVDIQQKDTAQPLMEVGPLCVPKPGQILKSNLVG